jgi:hypothetical protein
VRRLTLNKIKTVTLFGLILVAASTAAAQNNDWLSYEPAVVELKGTLVMEWKYGPPNFGENPRTDAKVRVPVLVLVKPVSVRPNPQDTLNAESVEGLRRMQLNLVNLTTPYKQLIGKRVFVSGSLFQAHTGHHYTKVVMDVRFLKPSKSNRSREERQGGDETSFKLEELHRKA